jgi:small subunit ribosomal protein S1
LDGSIDGLIHMSDISWSSAGDETMHNYKKGDEIEAVILAIDPERERISLGVKQLDKDPFSIFVAEHPKGSIVKGKVGEVDAKGAVIDLGEGIEGYLRASELDRERVEDARTVLNSGDEIEAKFTGVDRKNRTITLSVKAKDHEEETKVVEEYGRGSGQATTSLGDILKEQMDENEE